MKSFDKNSFTYFKACIGQPFPVTHSASDTVMFNLNCFQDRKWIIKTRNSTFLMLQAFILFGCGIKRVFSESHNWSTFINKLSFAPADSGTFPIYFLFFIIKCWHATKLKLRCCCVCGLRRVRVDICCDQQEKFLTLIKVFYNLCLI